MTKHYIHINSVQRQDHENKSAMTIHLNPPINNVSRACLSKFTIANTFFNIIQGYNDAVLWTEHYIVNNTPNDRFFANYIPEGYYTLDSLVLKVQELMNENPVYQVSGNGTKTYSRQFQTEVVPTFTLSLNDDFTISIVGSGSTGSKFWMLLDAGTNNLWTMLGFDNTQLTVNPIINQTVIDGTAKSFNASNKSVADRTLKSLQPGRESQPYLLVSSSALGTNSRQTHDNQTNSIGTIHSERFCTIPIDVNRYSWIHFNANQSEYEWHDIEGTLSTFDIRLEDSNGNAFQDQTHDDWSAMIIIETHEPKNEIQERNNLLFNREGYRLAHPC